MPAKESRIGKSLVPPQDGDKLHRAPLGRLRNVLIVVAYLSGFIILDILSQRFQELRGIVAWYPPAGLTYALLLVFGAWFAPAVTIALLISNLFVYRMPQPPYLLFLWAVIISSIYGAAAWFLRHRIHFDWHLRKSRDVAWLVVTAVFVSALLAVLSVSSSALSSDMPRSEVIRAIFLWWIGETVGVLTVTPFLLLYVMPWLKRFVEVQSVGLPVRASFPPPTLSILGQALSIALVFYWVFGASGLNEFRPVYLLTLPLIWIALDHGLKGVTAGIAVLNFGVTVAMWFFRFDLSHIGELQLLMIVNCIVGLPMGAVVTERKRTEQALRGSEEEYRRLVTEIGDGIITTDDRGVVLFANPALARIHGFEHPDQLVGRNFYEFIAPLYSNAITGYFQRIARGERPEEAVTLELVRPDGTQTIVEVRASAREDGGKVVGTHGVVRDITERKQAEEEITNLAKFPAENPNPVLRLSQDGIVMHANPASGALLRMWGCVMGGSAPEFWRDLAAESWASGENRAADTKYDGKDYSFFVVPVANQGYVNLYGQDITQRKQAEEEIKISNHELTMLFELSHSLAGANNLEDILDLVNRHAVESIHTTFARIALLEDEKFIMRAAYPVRVLDLDLGIGYQHPITSLPYTQRLLEQNEPIILLANNPGISNEEKKVLLLDFAQSLCLIPLRSSDSSPSLVNLLGFLMLGEARNEAREPFTPQKIRLAQSIGDLAAIAIRRMLLSEQTARRLQQSIALSEIDLAIISTSDMVVSLHTLLLKTTEQLGVDAADVWFYNPTSQELEFVIGHGFRTPAFENPIPIHLGEGNAGRAALERRTIHVQSLTSSNDNPRLAKALAVEPFSCYYAVPLIVKEQIKGVLELFHRTELEPNQEWLSFLNALASQAAIAIDNASLFKDLQYSNTDLTRAYDATIRGWSRALDLRDNETEGHTQRVTELTMKLARQFGLSEEEMVHVRRGALLHDIGKMGVPDGILLKPGALTDDEWLIMKKHPAFAYEMLFPIHYLKPALDIPYCHHEKWDGSGYPRGLSGDDIPFSARLFAVVDVWDALTSDRPYRKAWSEEKALLQIQAESGTHFDPHIVQVFLASDFLHAS